MQRTTISLEDALIEVLRLRAAREKRSLAAVVNDLLRLALRQSSGRQAADRPRWKTYRCGKALVDITDRDALYAVMDEP